jgi:hypothetical protein
MKEKETSDPGAVGKPAGQRKLTPAAERALAEAAERRKAREEASPPMEIDGRKGPDPLWRLGSKGYCQRFLKGGVLRGGSVKLTGK